MDNTNCEDKAQFLNSVVAILLDEAVIKGTRRSEPVTNWCPPEQLKEILNIELPDLPRKENDLLNLIRNTVKYSVKTGHPYFMNQLFSGLDIYGLVGQWVTDALNCSVYTYEVAPVFTLMEKNIIKKMLGMIGWTDGDGIFCPGGSIANGIGMNLARFNLNNEIKYKGVSSCSPLVAFASCDAHYSIKKMAALLGIGQDNIILVNTDRSGSMDVTDLKKCVETCIKESAIPFAVFATSGTTVLGAFDPLPSIADICKEYKLWLHVDAAWGGGLLFSNSHRLKLTDIKQADSITFNPHKLLGVPQQCSLLLTQHSGIFSKCHATQASYLFQPDKFYSADLDCGDSHIQCGRKPDVFKFWLMWQAKGSNGFQCHVDSIMRISNYFKQSVCKRSSFKLVIEPQYVNVCFWYIPPSLRNIDSSSIEFKEKLHKIAPKIKEKMVRKGSVMINYQPHWDKPNFFRFVTQNSFLNQNDIDYILDEIESLGSDL